MESKASLDTYRRLRAGMVAAGLLLGVGLVFSIIGSGLGIPQSISATPYTPLSTIFVTSLLAVGLALVAVKGRRGVENTLLDVAGALIPVVAFVPTDRRPHSHALDAVGAARPDPGRCGLGPPPGDLPRGQATRAALRRPLGDPDGRALVLHRAAAQP